MGNGEQIKRPQMGKKRVKNGPWKKEVRTKGRG